MKAHRKENPGALLRDPGKARAGTKSQAFSDLSHPTPSTSLLIMLPPGGSRHCLAKQGWGARGPGGQGAGAGSSHLESQSRRPRFPSHPTRAQTATGSLVNASLFLISHHRGTKMTCPTPLTLRDDEFKTKFLWISLGNLTIKLFQWENRSPAINNKLTNPWNVTCFQSQD